MAEERIGIIGGTGLGDALLEHITDLQKEKVETPFGATSTPVMMGTLSNRKIAFLGRHGQGHTLNPSRVPYAANIFALKKLGITTVLASGAVGSLRDEIGPKQLVIVDQFIDKTFRRQNSFFDQLGAVHCEFDQPCCFRLRRAILEVTSQSESVVHGKGTYVCMEGPHFSSRAESLMHQKWGGDVIGMTALPEAKLAREAQMCYALIALVSDYDAWRPHPAGKDKHDLLSEIIGNLNEATANAISLIKAILQSDLKLCSDTCVCRKSLEMAVWTKPEAVDKQQRKIMAPLFI
ncbi:MAG: MTAP family purine nucleoside phosphorylase [Sedimentisphaerales bacterium]|nr:MTAP family purine nucleoside phosphorylase [Sedimentisphaerales bacterium]